VCELYNKQCGACCRNPSPENRHQEGDLIYRARVPELAGKFDGVSIRTPVPVGSISDITLVASKNTTPEEINSILIEESKTARYKAVLQVSDQPLVSSDIVKSPFATVVDSKMTRVVDGDLVKVMAWYDNEWGFTNQMIRQIQEI
jgi:glyceraldehyde 3-phosphate dehydrogenase